MMWLSLLTANVLLLPLLLLRVEAFVPLPAASRHQSLDGCSTTTWPLQSTEQAETSNEASLKNEKDENKDKDDEKVASVIKPPFAEGSHEELIYCLGVNLARQLGDVRPLVENGEELTCVAKGLLDTVIGRLTEEGQREILSRRGKELNELITERA